MDHEDEYIDEDKYTTVTVESVTIGRDGFHKPRLDSSDEEAEGNKPPTPADRRTTEKKEKTHAPKKPKKKFRYESKIVREISGSKQKAKRISRAKNQ